MSMTPTTLTPRVFFESVVKPNADELSKHHNDIRLAINAIVTADALFGILYAELRSKNRSAVANFADDDRYRDDLASRSRDYRILRDVAFSIKHGELRRKKPRLVKNVRQIQTAIAGFGILMCGYDRTGETVLLIHIPSSNSNERPEFIIHQVLKLAQDELAKFGL
jgi:hypothetical protein